MIELGQKATDRVTGFSGFVTGRVEYITGCKQLLVQPRVKPDGDIIESRWLDEDRLEGLPEFISLTVTANGSDKSAPRR